MTILNPSPIGERVSPKATGEGLMALNLAGTSPSSDRSAITFSLREKDAKFGSPRQRRFAHQLLIDAMGCLAAFADRPYHQGLATTHIAAGVDVIDA